MLVNQETNVELRDSRPQNKKRISWKAWLVLFIILCILVSMASPFVIGKRRDADRTATVGQAKQINIALTEFEDEHGTNLGAQGATSNDCFRTLIQRLPTVRSEAIFYAPSRISRIPDNDIGDASDNFAKACAKGEVGFLYVHAPTAKDGAPLVAAPLYDNAGRFDAEAYNGSAVVLKPDGTVELRKIDPDTGKIMIKVDGKLIDLFSSENPLFTDPPMIKYPEPK